MREPVEMSENKQPLGGAAGDPRRLLRALDSTYSTDPSSVQRSETSSAVTSVTISSPHGRAPTAAERPMDTAIGLQRVVSQLTNVRFVEAGAPLRRSRAAQRRWDPRGHWRWRAYRCARDVRGAYLQCHDAALHG